jgi:hypothetical protein
MMESLFVAVLSGVLVQLIVPRLPGFVQSRAKPQDTYQVLLGDTLSTIASKKLGCACLWPALWRLNKSIIGDDPNHVLAGRFLRIPKPSEIQQGERDKAAEHCNVHQARIRCFNKARRTCANKASSSRICERSKPAGH